MPAAILKDTRGNVIAAFDDDSLVYEYDSIKRDYCNLKYYGDDEYEYGYDVDIIDDDMWKNERYIYKDKIMSAKDVNEYRELCKRRYEYPDDIRFLIYTTISNLQHIRHKTKNHKIKKRLKISEHDLMDMLTKVDFLLKYEEDDD